MMNFERIESNDAELYELVEAVNIERLRNTPVELTKEDILKIYQKALKK